MWVESIIDWHDHDIIWVGNFVRKAWFIDNNANKYKNVNIQTLKQNHETS